jgi:carbon-monoxide dehydrogenase small subunit
MDVTFSVNGDRVRLDVEPRRTLADALRENLGLTGTHLGCEHGVCGACTVLVDGEPARACLMFAVQADGSSLTTVEGLEGQDGALHPLQESFVTHHGLQCGFCTPGMLMSALHLIDTDPGADREKIREEMSGNICRCTGYQGIVDAIVAAGQAVGAEGDQC